MNSHKDRFKYKGKEIPEIQCSTRIVFIKEFSIYKSRDLWGVPVSTLVTEEYAGANKVVELDRYRFENLPRKNGLCVWEPLTDRGAWYVQSLFERIKSLRTVQLRQWDPREHDTIVKLTYDYSEDNYRDAFYGGGAHEIEYEIDKVITCTTNEELAEIINEYAKWVSTFSQS